MKVLEMNIMDMNELEIKNILHDIIQKTHSRQELLRYFDVVRNIEIQKEAYAIHDVEEEDDDSDGWSDLTPEQQKKLEFAIAQSYDPAQSVSYEDGLKMIDKWLTR